MKRKRKKEDHTCIEHYKKKRKLNKKTKTLEGLANFLQSFGLSIESLKDFTNTIQDTQIKKFVELEVMKFESNEDEDDVDVLRDKVIDAIVEIVSSDISSLEEDTIEKETQYRDPITLELMEDPVVLKVSGKTFDFVPLLRALEQRQVCPVTKIELPRNTNDLADCVVKNYALGDAIRRFKNDFVERTLDISLVLKSLVVDQVLELKEKSLVLLEKAIQFDNIQKEIVFVLHEKFAGELAMGKADDGDQIQRLIDSRINLAKFYDEHKDKDKAVFILEKKVLGMKFVSLKQKDRSLSILVDLYVTGRSTSSRASRRRRNKVHRYCVDLIQVCLDRGNLERARTLFEKYKLEHFTERTIENLTIHAQILTSQMPNKACSMFLGVAKMYLDDEELEKAEEILEKAIKIRLSGADAKSDLRGLLYNVKTKLNRSKNKLVHEILELVKLSEQLGNIDRQKKYLEEIMKLDENHEESKKKLMVIYLQSGDYEGFQRISKLGIGGELLLKKVGTLDRKVNSLDRDFKVKVRSLEQKFESKVNSLEQKFETKVRSLEQGVVSPSTTFMIDCQVDFQDLYKLTSMPNEKSPVVFRFAGLGLKWQLQITKGIAGSVVVVIVSKNNDPVIVRMLMELRHHNQQTTVLSTQQKEFHRNHGYQTTLTLAFFLPYKQMVTWNNGKNQKEVIVFRITITKPFCK